MVLKWRSIHFDVLPGGILSHTVSSAVRTPQWVTQYSLMVLYPIESANLANVLEWNPLLLPAYINCQARCELNRKSRSTPAYWLCRYDLSLLRYFANYGQNPLGNHEQTPSPPKKCSDVNNEYSCMRVCFGSGLASVDISKVSAVWLTWARVRVRPDWVQFRWIFSLRPSFTYIY